jgi:hypothetical protein
MAKITAPRRQPGAMGVSGINRYTDMFGCIMAETTMRNAANVGRLRITTSQNDV